MATVTKYELGSPCWLDIASPDPATSKGFYRDLFGWSSYTLASDTMNDYEMFTLGGVDGPTVAGMQELVDDTQPPSWTCYFRVADAAAVCSAVIAAGGQELLPPTDIYHLGRMALFADPNGADFAVWEPFGAAGAEIIAEPSAMCWVELASHDTEESRRFYGEVFGWRPEDRHYYEKYRYTNWRIGDRPVGGMVYMDEEWPADWPGDWIPYIQVEDTDAAADRSVGLGARIIVPPSDLAPGRFTVIVDPTGARLAMITPRTGVDMLRG